MEIEREILHTLEQWKNAADRKPVLLTGARQTGKTWVMETFGRRYFDYCVKFDFDRQPELKSVFQTSKSPDRILKELPETLEAHKSREWVVMNLEEAKAFFELSFHKSRFHLFSGR